MREVQPAPKRTRARRTWGVHEAAVSRYGTRHVRLSILPPDLSSSELRSWRTLQVWPAAGLLFGAITIFATWAAIGAAGAIVLGMTVWLLPWVWLWLGAHDIVTRVHTACADGPLENDHSDVESIERLALRMERAADDYLHGRLSDTGFRAVWAGVYDAIDVREPSSGQLAASRAAR